MAVVMGGVLFVGHCVIFCNLYSKSKLTLEDSKPDKRVYRFFAFLLPAMFEEAPMVAGLLFI